MYQKGYPPILSEFFNSGTWSVEQRPNSMPSHSMSTAIWGTFFFSWRQIPQNGAVNKQSLRLLSCPQSYYNQCEIYLLTFERNAFHASVLSITVKVSAIFWSHVKRRVDFNLDDLNEPILMGYSIGLFKYWLSINSTFTTFTDAYPLSLPY